MKRIVLVVAALLLAPTAARAQMQATALAIDARLGGGVSVATFGGAGNLGGGGASANLTVGARLIDRLQVGLGLTLFRYSTPTGGGVIGGGTTANTTFTLSPTLAVDLLKAKDNKVAWYGKIALPVGANVVSNNGAGNNTQLVIGYDVGFGVRYCPHPNVAFGLEAGLNGIFVDPTGNGGYGLTSVYGAAVGTFYWGKSNG